MGGRDEHSPESYKIRAMLHPYPEMNNYPIHAFDHIENTAAPTPDAAFLSKITYRGLTGAYPIAGNPKLRRADCDCVLGLRLQDKPKVLDPFKEEEAYPPNKFVAIGFVTDLLGTFMYGSEEGQIRSVSDEERTVELYATVYEGDPAFDQLKRDLKLHKDAEEYSLSVVDFSTPAIDRHLKRGRTSLAIAKEYLMSAASNKMKTFLSVR